MSALCHVTGDPLPMRDTGEIGRKPVKMMKQSCCLATFFLYMFESLYCTHTYYLGLSTLWVI